MLELSTKPNEKKNVEKIKRVLDTYLSRACSSMVGLTRKDAKRAAGRETDIFLHADPFFTRGKGELLLKNPQEAQKIIAEEEKDLAAKAKNYGMREKINYAINGSVRAEPSEDFVKAFVDDFPLILGTAVVGAVGTTAFLDMGAQPEAQAMLLGTLAFIPAVKAVEAGLAIAAKPRTKEQKISSAEYTEIKHSQLALKQMKKALKNETKAVEKAEYKKMVAEAYAMSTPGGTLVGALNKRGGR